MSPQWLGLKEKKHDVLKDKRSQCKIDDEEAMLLFYQRTRRFTIKHDPKMLVPILTVNLGIKNYRSFSTAFCSITQKEPDFQCLPEDHIENSTYEDGHHCLRSIDARRHLSACKDAAETIKHNEDLENKLLKVQEEARRIGTASTFNKDQLELVKNCEGHNYATSVADMQLLAATGIFSKRLSKCTMPSCTT